MRCTLYGRSGCHLCDVARVELQALERSGLITLEYCDIDAQSDVPEEYAERIPVVRTERGGELFWPFRAVEVLHAP